MIETKKEIPILLNWVKNARGGVLKLPQHEEKAGVKIILTPVD